MDTKDQESGMEMDIMNVHEVARYLRVNEAKIYRLARSAGIPAFRLGGAWRFRRCTIDEWILKESQENLKLTEERFSQRLTTTAANPVPNLLP